MVGSDTTMGNDSFADLSVRSLLPDVNSLEDATICLREYVALVLSDLRN